MCTLDERYLRRVGGGEAESVDGREQMMAIAGGSEGEREPAGARYGVSRIWIVRGHCRVDSEDIDRRRGGWSGGYEERRGAAAAGGGAEDGRRGEVIGASGG